MYDDLIELVERSKVAFPKKGNGASMASISRAETDLGLPLPESYKWWLLNYGAGQIKGDLVYGLDENGIGLPDIVELARINDENGLYNKDKLVFSTGNEEDFFFDTTTLINGEYPVFWLEDSQNEMIYAASFADFLRKRIRELYGLGTAFSE